LRFLGIGAAPRDEDENREVQYERGETDRPTPWLLAIVNRTGLKDALALTPG
jgi:hypothetical protein